MNEQNGNVVDFSKPKEIIDFVSLVRVLWQRRVFIVSGLVILAVIGALIVFLAPRRYLCEAFFQVGNLDIKITKKTNMSIPVFKQGELLLNNMDHLKNLMIMDPEIGNTERERFFRHNRNGKNLHKYLSPVTNYTRMAPLSNDEGSSIIGFKLAFTGKTQESARKFVEFFASYIRSSYLAIDLNEYILRNIESYGRSVIECENKEITYRGQLEHLNKQKDKLEVLARRFPRFSNADELQVQKMTKPSVHYMSPSLRLNAVESQLMGMNAAIDENSLKKETCILLLQFYTRARQLLAKKKDNGVELLADLRVLKTDIFLNLIPRTSAAQQAENTINLDLQRFQGIYFGVFQFVVGPTVLLVNALPTRICQVIWITVFSLLFMIMAALLLFWASRNWKKIAG